MPHAFCLFLYTYLMNLNMYFYQTMHYNFFDSVGLHCTQMGSSKSIGHIDPHGRFLNKIHHAIPMQCAPSYVKVPKGSLLVFKRSIFQTFWKKLKKHKIGSLPEGLENTPLTSICSRSSCFMNKLQFHMVYNFRR